MQKKKARISKCPANVRMLIDAANSLPPDFINPLISNFTNTRTYLELVRSDIETQKSLFNEVVSTLPQTFIDTDKCLRAFLHGNTIDNSERPGWIPKDKWEEKWFVSWWENPRKTCSFSPFQQLKSAFSRVIDIRKSLRLAIEYSKPREPIPGLHPITTVDEYPEVTAKFRTHNIDSKTIPFKGFEALDGILKVELDDTFTVLVNEKIDTRRIKECQNCSRFFWAKRIGKGIENKVCDKCSNAQRQRDFQKKNKDLINARRSKSRFDRQVKEAQKDLRNAKTDFDKVKAQETLQSAISKRTIAAHKLNNLKSTPAEKNNGTV
jgi:hypothetical protein